jgi:hypothetical protein
MELANSSLGAEIKTRKETNRPFSDQELLHITK